MSLILKYDLGNPHRLPVGYTPLAYIESSGTLYIDTTCLGNSNTSIILDYIYTELVSSAGIIGTGRGSTTEPMNGFRFYYGGANKYYVSCNSKLNASTLPSSPLYYAGERYHTLMNGSSGVITTNGVSVTVSSYGAGSDNTYSLMLFKAYSTCCKAKLYKCTIILNGLTIRDFIPAKNSSDIVGLFDCVSQTFFTNQGTGSFIAGPEVVVLPYEYLLVEYLESDGTSVSPYIKFTDRGLLADDTIQINASILRVNNNAQPSIFGWSGVALIYFPNKVLSYWKSEYIQGSSPNAGTTITLGTRYEFKSTIKNTLASWNLFTYTSSYYPANARLELVIITRNSNVIMRLISCYRRSDLKPGMYDTVNNVFYTNSGSGEFILGPVVEESSRQLEYNNAGSNYIGKPTNVHHSISNPSTTQINEGSGDFSGGATIRTTIPALNNSYSISWWANGVYGGKMMWSIGNLNPLYNLCLNSGDSNNDPWYRPGTTTQITAPSNNVWHHFVITGDGSSNKLYVDGIHYGTAKTYKSCTGSALGLNYYAGYAAYQWNGKMYDFRIYNNVLTADEVLKIYKGGV